MQASPHFDEYRSEPSFAARFPLFPYRDHEDEAEDLSDNSLVVSLEEASTNQQSLRFTEMEATSDDVWISSYTTLDSKYLWLIRTDDVKIALENGSLRRHVTGESIKHTNLKALSTPILRAAWRIAEANSGFRVIKRYLSMEVLVASRREVRPNLTLLSAPLWPRVTLFAALAGQKNSEAHKEYCVKLTSNGNH